MATFNFATFALLSLLGAASAADPHLLSSVQAHFDLFFKAFEDKDVDQLVYLFDANATVMVPNHTAFRGKPGARDYFNMVLPQFSLLTLTAVDADWLQFPTPGQPAYLFARGNCSIGDPATRAYRSPCSVLQVWKIDTDGVWQIYVDAAVVQPAAERGQERKWGQGREKGGRDEHGEHGEAVDARAASAARLPTPVQQLIASVNQKWMSAYASGNMSALANFYTDDAVLLPDGEAPANGHIGIARYFSRVMETDIVTIELIIQDSGVTISDQYLFERSVYVSRNHAGDMVDIGKTLSIWLNRGTPLLYLTCLNSDKQ